MEPGLLWHASNSVTRHEVVPGLWQGDWPYPSDLTPFDVLVSMTAEGVPPTPSVRPGFQHIVAGIHDAEMDQPDLVRDTAQEVARLHARGHTVLVHCAQGLNRSGVVVARALMFEGWSAKGAIGAVREARGPWALCNHHFVDWLYAEAEATTMAAVWG